MELKENKKILLKKKHLGERRPEIKTKEYDTQTLTEKIWGKRKASQNSLFSLLQYQYLGFHHSKKKNTKKN